jgi:hypothetical protein
VFHLGQQVLVRVGLHPEFLGLVEHLEVTHAGVDRVVGVLDRDAEGRLLGVVHESTADEHGEALGWLLDEGGDIRGVVNPDEPPPLRTKSRICIRRAGRPASR